MNLADIADVSVFLQRAGEALRRPFVLPQGSVQISASLGVSCYPSDGESAPCLLRKADVAMYAAKQQRDTYRMFGTMLASAGSDTERAS